LNTGAFIRDGVFSPGASPEGTWKAWWLLCWYWAARNWGHDQTFWPPF